MAKKEGYEEKLEELVLPFLSENGFELYDTEYVKEGANWYLRAYIDKPGGITIDDCELVSRYLSEQLDQKDMIPEAYILEVSSPGLGRQLKKDRHFEKSIGERIEVKLYKGTAIKLHGKEAVVKELDGILTAFDKEQITIETEEKEQISIKRNEAALVRLAFDF